MEYDKKLTESLREEAEEDIKVEMTPRPDIVSGNVLAGRYRGKAQKELRAGAELKKESSILRGIWAGPHPLMWNQVAVGGRGGRREKNGVEC